MKEEIKLENFVVRCGNLKTLGNKMKWNLV